VTYKRRRQGEDEEEEEGGCEREQPTASRCEAIQITETTSK
jgi:hypothetical protein